MIGVLSLGITVERKCSARTRSWCTEAEGRVLSSRYLGSKLSSRKQHRHFNRPDQAIGIRQEGSRRCLQVCDQHGIDLPPRAPTRPRA
ncbi:uncharacterized protein [Zea mays]|uniref:uncharacterized protein n=1 Tax=Zea mays TaxID=4577 RepID=UPI0004DEA377|nr:uncharacterized protein LOC118472151 [Zea mays]|eukprot:XP_008648434.1 uncharacterized protein LOC100279705 [Zea mays]